MIYISKPKLDVMTEKVLVIDRDKLFDGSKRYFQGFKRSGNTGFIEAIKRDSYFVLRKETSDTQPRPAEHDESMKQIIPYVVFRHGGSYFTYQRLEKSGEERLRSNFSIGIGGHINPIDKSGDIITDGMRREFLEEVDYPHEFSAKVIGYINDDSDSVGRVHFGVVFLIDADDPDINVRETEILKGSLRSLHEIGQIRDKLEGWSKIVFDYLMSSGDRVS
jgi:predicted NUDIX family phosphoesterase